MRGLGLFMGWGPRRNQPYKLKKPSPDYPYPQEAQLDTGNAGADGYTVLSRADPNYAGRMPNGPGVEYQDHLGPDESFEQ